MRPTSRRRRGRLHCAATALAVRLFPQPCTPRSRSPLGSGRPKLSRRLAEGRGPSAQPELEVVDPADLLQPLLDRVVLEEPALADDLALLVEDELHVAGVEAVVLGDGLGEGVLGLGEGEALGGLDEGVGVAAVDVDGGAVVLAQHLHDLGQELAQVLEGGQGDVEDRHVLLELGGDAEARGQEHEGGVGRLQVVRQLAHPAHHDGIVQEGVEVLEDHERRIGELLDGGERLHRVLGAVDGRDVARALDLAQALGGRPEVEGLAVVLGQVLEDDVQALLFPRGQVHQRVARPHERVELAHEGGHRSGAPVRARRGHRRGGRCSAHLVA